MLLIFDNFVVENIRQEIKSFIGNNNIKTNILRIQAYDSIIFEYYWIWFIDFMLAGKNPNLSVAPNDQQHFRLNKINEIKDYFVAEIKKEN